MISKMRANRPTIHFICVAIAVLILTAREADASCILSVETTQDQLVIRHNPLEGEVAYGTIEVNLVNRGESECIVRPSTLLRSEQMGLSSETGGTIVYQLVDEKSRIDITPRGGRSLDVPGGRSLRLKPGERSLEVISLTAFPGGMIGAGRYTQSLDLTFSSSDGAVQGARPLTLAIDIATAALIGMKGELSKSRAVASVDLGELSQGAKDLPLMVYVISTGGYRVSASSENLGRLKHADAPWFVNYRLRLGDRQLDLSAVDGFEVNSLRARSDNYPVRIEIGDTAKKRAGVYTDTVTLTVAAL